MVYIGDDYQLPSGFTDRSKAEEYLFGTADYYHYPSEIEIFKVTFKKWEGFFFDIFI